MIGYRRTKVLIERFPLDDEDAHETRRQVTWGSVDDPRASATEAVVGTRDGVAHFVRRTVEHDRDSRAHLSCII